MVPKSNWNASEVTPKMFSCAHLMLVPAVKRSEMLWAYDPWTLVLQLLKVVPAAPVGSRIVVTGKSSVDSMPKAPAMVPLPPKTGAPIPR